MRRTNMQIKQDYQLIREFIEEKGHTWTEVKNKFNLTDSQIKVSLKLHPRIATRLMRMLVYEENKIANDIVNDDTSQEENHEKTPEIVIDTSILETAFLEEVNERCIIITSTVLSELNDIKEKGEDKLLLFRVGTTNEPVTIL